MIRDFKWKWRGVTARETGAFIPFSFGLVRDLWRGGFYIIVETLRPPIAAPRFRVHSDPARIRPWYLAWAMIKRAGGRTAIGVRPSKDADAPEPNLSIYFSDKTHIASPPKKPAGVSLNYACLDISKSRVADVFEKVFGYSLAVDPTTYHGPMVQKSEENGAHDGEIIVGPCLPKPGYVHQRLINNQTDRGTVADIRCPTLDGKVMLVFIKERPTAQRFANFNNCSQLDDPKNHLTNEENTLIKQFCEKLKLDYGGLDVLRDIDDGRIYIVDANKTDMGPPLALPLRDKLKAVTIMAEALTKFVHNNK